MKDVFDECHWPRIPQIWRLYVSSFDPERRTANEGDRSFRLESIRGQRTIKILRAAAQED
jgi:hypothetical protein